MLTLFLTLNDVAHSSPPLRRLQVRQRGLVPVQLLTGTLAAERVPLFLVRRSALNQFLSYRLALWLGTRDAAAIPVDYFVYARPETALWRDAWRRAEELLLETRDAARELGADYALASATTPHGVLGPEAGRERLLSRYPAMREWGWDLDGPDRRLRAFCGEHDIPFLALEPAFREAVREGGRFHWRYDGHWNAPGNDLAGRLIADFVRELGGDPGSRETVP